MGRYNWQQKGWSKATCNRAALRDELKDFAVAFRVLSAQGAIVREGIGGPATRYRLTCSLNEPIDPLNDPLKASLPERLLKVVARHPGAQLSYLASVESAVSQVTVKRAIAALVVAGKLEHRGSKKTGGYYAL